MPSQTVGESGGNVQHYNLYGNQHHRKPFVDKSQHHNAPSDTRWHQKPMYGSRTELQQARKQWKVPDKSYDVDGDGVVGQRDYFIGKSFDNNHNDVLSSQEQQEVAKNLNQGWMDRFQWGHDVVGTKKPVTTRQVRGVILTSDDVQAIGETYPAHHNSHKNAGHITKTELQLDRKAEAKAVNAAIMERWCHQNPLWVKEFIAGPEKDHIDAPCTHIRQRAEADHQLARVRGGMLSYTYPVNPEREEKTIGDPRDGRGYVASPVFRTRSQLLETRKELHKDDCERLRMEGEQILVPHSVREGIRENAYFDYRRAGPEPMTMTKLKQQRKQDRIEYDMANFADEKRQFPRFCDQPNPWWTMGKSSPSPKPARMHKSVSEPVIKVTDAPSAFATKVEVGPVVGPVQPLPHDVLEEPLPRPLDQIDDMYMGNQTIKRYTSDMIEMGQLRNQPRLFDSLPPIRTDKTDFVPLDRFSSFEIIKQASYGQERHVDKEPVVSKIKNVLDKMMPQMPKSAASHSASGTSSTGPPERHSPGPRSIAAESGTSSANAEGATGLAGKGAFSPPKKTDHLPAREVPNFVGGSPSPPKNPGFGGVRCGGFQLYDQHKTDGFKYGSKSSPHRDRTYSTGKTMGLGAASSAVQMALKGRGARSRTQTGHSVHSS